MSIRDTFKVVSVYIRYFFLRRDKWLWAFLAFTGAYSAGFIGSFVFLFNGLSDYIGGRSGSVSGRMSFLPQLPSDMAITVGVALLGISALCSMAAVYSGTKTAANFGLGMVLKFHPRWDELSAQEKKRVVITAEVATSYGRLVLIAAMPLVMVAFGIALLMYYNAWLGLAILAIGVVGLFAFVPVDRMTRALSRPDFDRKLDRATLGRSRRELRAFLMRRLDMFMARRLIASANLFLLFLVVLAGIILLGPDGITGLFNEQTVIIVVLMRATFTSLTRLTICLRVARKRIERMKNVVRVLATGEVPLETGDGDDTDFDDEDN